MGCIFAPTFSSATLGVQGSEAGVASAMVNTSQQVGTSLLSTIFASSAATYAASHLRSPGLADAAAVHVHRGSPSSWRLSSCPAAPSHIATFRTALARHAIGKCHHFEPAGDASNEVDATTEAEAR
jgi:hypothetical protein